MANGDAAAAAGLPVVPSTKDIRLGYDDLNKLADALAAHMVSGGHPWAKISSKPETYPSTWATVSGKPLTGLTVAESSAGTALISVTHGLGYVPTFLSLTLCGVPMGTANDEVARLADLVLWRVDATVFEVRVRRIDTSAWFNGQRVAFTWIVG